MEPKERTWRKTCKRCGEVFISETKFRTICDNCNKGKYLKKGHDLWKKKNISGKKN